MTTRALPTPPRSTSPSTKRQEEVRKLEESFKHWVEVGLDGPGEADMNLTFAFCEQEEFPWFAAWEGDNFYDGDTVRLVGSQRSRLSDKTVTMLRLTDYWRRSVEKLVVQKQSLMRWLEAIPRRRRF
ncbi:hypothetical protein CJU89_6523 [Yarrowia sp. B02]|nr:hypothetical protein CJU89_6523 [Yarrowia sp. B02]